ncbi:hypothetical protein A2574_01020 [Candidatus Shapirobacteria bacterium RIFOXYD1_FULL_38_32]|nr:MAG: hypothetical protein A2195_01430 [Candidatus Shapirobacteria bacterium RIFOXYA1_FULL_39_17]OGL57235.1 MAG: hypothetical protein A2574_01020 [Candidatus Shapirobacteria bacterium RIFOXYD1_FULL_38_32]OGL57606.1 MAG: hypothetical protein A2410_02265 [Candidatus Shapirobacteria bacterium RIFOXYC1_FULL_38_24]HAP37861.1 transcription elongation factor GreA [Candidatus Shapirobacteria bacterium]HCU55272.1 transcription elongation factor GreA [Candidatus Shapirobacteria bacterium]
MANKTLLTKEGYQKLVFQLNELKDKRDTLVTRIEEVTQTDESGEDGLTTQLKEELELISNKIDVLEEALEGSEIISGAINTNHVNIGCKVKIKLSNIKELEFNIVSELEADPANNKISDQSPLGQALLGKKINDEIMVDAPAGKITYKILAIN